ncbi:glutathione S-transferase C-terminal-like protein [Coniophora puteana RWD-64-598 SS2]|uniref:Glutathione S-transferase C-terminal-like protein n=1 Tax=Coniophora puteana (strain RWD-64-598) TaxID=741705 RepID=A0A5M3MZ30_CONPW|nr:glutathione S-transferase C-terminal-like protein [Coniophora puteana RWD-64-598 SS2]EIW84054.1 glutathione S-transferase C-terminal-like protein [Coniophora puteana RWD-64-598 SS2]
MSHVGTFYGFEKQRQAITVRAVAAFTGQSLITPPVIYGETNKTPEYLALFPFGKVPAFKGADGFLLTEGATIARYLAARNPESGLLGNDIKESALIDHWVHFAETNLHTNLEPIFFWSVGIAPGYTPEQTDWLYDRAIFGLGHVESYLGEEGGREYLVAGRLTLADLVMAATIYFATRVVLGKKERDALPRTMAYFERIKADERVGGEITEPEYLEVRWEGKPVTN